MTVTSPRLTVLTASFDRAHLLNRLHHSLITQEVPPGQVEWLVIDDGSTDDTARELQRLARMSGPVAARVLRIPHGGKHRALNVRFVAARGAWVMVIDSDDWCRPGALQTAMEETAKAERHGAFAVIAPLVVPRARRQYRFARPDRATTFVQRSNEEPPFDCTLIFRRDTPGLRFPEFEGEDFLAEGALMFKLGRQRRVWLSSKVLVSAEYQPGGLSATIRRKRMEAPLGACHTYQVMLASRLRPALRPRALANFGRFWWHAVLARKRPPRPASVAQLLSLGAGWAFCAADHLHEKRDR